MKFKKRTYQKETIQFDEAHYSNQRADTANIFIHGYSAGHDQKDQDQLKSRVTKALGDQLNLFCFWRSGHIKDLDDETRRSLLKVRQISEVLGATSLVGDRYAHFRRSRGKAEFIGKIFTYELNKYLAIHHPTVTTVNLIGHSLGARLLVYALKHTTNDILQNVPVHDVLLMGAAIDNETFDTNQLQGVTTGRLLNVYSKSDRVLLANFTETCLGRNAIDGFSNHEMPGFGHMDYWPNLEKVLHSVGFII